MENIVVLNLQDNVGNAVEDIAQQAPIVYKAQLEHQSLRANQAIPFGFKVALKPIQKGEAVIKYGVIIGLASQTILPGDLVHIHNLEGRRGRGDLENEVKGCCL